MSALVVRGDAGRLPLSDASVDLIVTSPPYFALRSYTDGGEHYAGQLGAEATPAEYIAALIACTREWTRVLKPSGSIFVNLGDKYAPRPPRRAAAGTPTKSLMLLPERYRIAAVDDLGLIARAVLVWSKPNGLPESVTDRVRRSHEDWVHLTKQPRYFAAVDEIREPHNPVSVARSRRAYNAGDSFSVGSPNTLNPAQFVNPLGKLPGSVWRAHDDDSDTVWTIATEPLKVPDRLAVDHFAAFPSEWPRRLILGWSPTGVCTDCGEGRRPVTQQTNAAYAAARAAVKLSTPRDAMMGGARGTGAGAASLISNGVVKPERTITGYACACTPYTDHPERRSRTTEAWPDHNYGDHNKVPPSGRDHNRDAAERAARRAEIGPVREYHFDRWTPPPTRPAVVLDPFGGTGTTAHVADALGRTGITVDLSRDYCRLAAAPELAERRRGKVERMTKGKAR